MRLRSGTASGILKHLGLNRMSAKRAAHFGHPVVNCRTVRSNSEPRANSPLQRSAA